MKLDRRTLLCLLGASAATPALPKLPVLPAAFVAPVDILAGIFSDPVFVTAFTCGARGERYRHSMPARVRIESGRVTITADANFTGTLHEPVLVQRGEEVLCRVPLAEMDTLQISRGWILDIKAWIG